MKLYALSDPDEIGGAYALLSRRLKEDGETRETTIGYQGGNETVSVEWHSNEGFWVLLAPKRIENRYWCAYGLDEPHPGSLLPITCEINIPREGVDRRIGGAFARDTDSGELFLVHSGKVGGGRAGIGMENFLDNYRGTFYWLYRKTGGKDEVILVGGLADEDLRVKIGCFIREVAEFKERMVK